ncbi:hypothetical protein [Gracilimonas sediminicola]|uniref:Uncharacterized protein n=1 Tax=Gracilimonas sediminicola TaxID=2952158 RepID=A0A9X2RGF4_9BACT|nr:hypothetical protein [Gracilimonas sediminicola]MCP9291478.1 hypothetical protein [Gracilimonas sediminicola]
MNIKDTLISALQGDKHSINRLCDHFRRISVAYLRTKANRNNLLLSHLYKNIDDLALDCIADLFGQEGDCLSQIEGYLDDTEIEKLKESEVATKLRRLIFSKVNEGLYRNYRNFDPSLSKIIRNLKRTLDEGKVEGARYDSNTGDIEFEEKDKPRANMPEEILEIKLSSALSRISNTVDAVQELKNILIEEREYSSKVSLVSFAVILRKSFAYRLEMEEKDKLGNSMSLYKERELHTFIKNCIATERVQLFQTYVSSGKINEKHFEKYLLVVKDILVADFIKHSPREGYFEHFEFYFPEISYERYRDEYRKIIEYMAKGIRQRLLLVLKNEENFSKFDLW